MIVCTLIDARRNADMHVSVIHSYTLTFLPFSLDHSLIDSLVMFKRHQKIQFVYLFNVYLYSSFMVRIDNKV